MAISVHHAGTAGRRIVEVYGRRWNIETDLRSLKRTVRLHHIHARSEEMMGKEILMAVSAYDLVRAVMCLAAQRNRIDPRQLSFTQVLNVVDAAWGKLIAAPSKQHHDQEFFRVLDLATHALFPSDANIVSTHAYSGDAAASIASERWKTK